MKTQVTILSEDILNKLWLSWLEQERDRVGLSKREEYFFARRLPYIANGRKTNKAERFEQWLFTNGAEVRRVSGKIHLEFTDDSMATLFALKYS